MWWYILMLALTAGQVLTIHLRIKQLGHPISEKEAVVRCVVFIIFSFFFTVFFR